VPEHDAIPTTSTLAPATAASRLNFIFSSALRASAHRKFRPLIRASRDTPAGSM
jgi:hypothetical protein